MEDFSERAHILFGSNNNVTQMNAEVEIIPMTDADLKDGGETLCISFDFTETKLGKILIASSQKGLCHVAFYEDQCIALAELKREFPQAYFQQSRGEYFFKVSDFFQGNVSAGPLRLHVKASSFQIKVWKELLKIPFGVLTTYGVIAAKLGDVKSARAVGTAIGNNKIAYLIPCHRVVQKSGKVGGYKWGIQTKTRLLKWEADEI